MKPDDARHATYAGWQRHRIDGEKPCDPCRLAANTYMREFRRKNRESARRQAARSRALHRLAAMHRDEFNELFVIEVMRDQGVAS